MKVNKILENLRRKISSQKQQSNGSLEKDKEKMGMGNGEDKTPKGNGYSEKDLLEDMPTLREVVDPEKKRTLLIKKIDLCGIIFDFTKANNVFVINKKNEKEKSHQLARNNKRQYLIELVEHAGQSKQWCSEEVMPHAVEMLSTNLFRALPPPMYADFDPEEDEPNFDPAWPHVQFVYEFFHKFVMTTDVKLLVKHMTKEFLAHTVDLFNSEDPREREYVKMILHRIYGRCMKSRCFIRRTIHQALLLVIYDNVRHNGISELLEILGSIINGFAVPLKKEHVHFLRQVLIPLHKIPTLSQFHQQLAYCVTQFIQKDASLAGDVLSGMLKFWPVKSCQKEILFLSELEEVLELTATPQIESVI
ncbi:protein phosphatase 2A regulatory subunit B, partial [Reticulomyxa filosa]